MTVDKISNVRTRDAADHFQVTLRIWNSELKEPTFDKELADRIRRAVDGIDDYGDGQL